MSQESNEEEYEYVDNPKHYQFFGEESLSMMKKLLTYEEFVGFCKGNALKYRIRAGKKPGISSTQDIEKALYYEKIYEREFKLKIEFEILMGLGGETDEELHF
jgi:hypothetical protein